VNESRLAEDLEKTWEVLAEPIQTVRHPVFLFSFSLVNFVLVSITMVNHMLKLSSCTIRSLDGLSCY
jgi:hypothetical protein